MKCTSLPLRRREFITLLGGAAAAWPLAARAQHDGIAAAYRSPARGPVTREQGGEAFRLGLRDAGYSEGRNVVIEWRSANGDYASSAGIGRGPVQQQSRCDRAGQYGRHRANQACHIDYPDRHGRSCSIRSDQAWSRASRILAATSLGSR